jgi:hypothetical protein
MLADRERVRRLFEIFYRNAVEHAGPAVTVEGGQLASDEGFYIADDGPGIPPAKREAIFDGGYSEGDTGIGPAWRSSRVSSRLTSGRSRSPKAMLAAPASRLPA